MGRLGSGVKAAQATSGRCGREAPTPCGNSVLPKPPVCVCSKGENPAPGGGAGPGDIELDAAREPAPGRNKAVDEEEGCPGTCTGKVAAPWPRGGGDREDGCTPPWRVPWVLAAARWAAKSFVFRKMLDVMDWAKLATSCLVAPGFVKGFLPGSGGRCGEKEEMRAMLSLRCNCGCCGCGGMSGWGGSAAGWAGVEGSTGSHGTS